MYFNITPKDCEFNVDYEHRKITCTYQNSSRLFIDFINSICRIGTQCDNLFKETGTTMLEDYLFMPSSFKGEAFCSKADTWNEELGRLIAFSRMKDNLCKSFFKHANTYFNKVDKWLDDSFGLVNKIGRSLTVNQERRHQLIEEKIEANGVS